MSEKVSIRRECWAQAALSAWCGMDELIDAVSAQYGCERQELLRPWKCCSEPRQVLLYLAAEKCRGRYSRTEIAEQVGPISVSGLAKARQLMSARLERDRRLRRRVRELLQQLTVISNS